MTTQGVLQNTLNDQKEYFALDDAHYATYMGFFNRDWER